MLGALIGAGLSIVANGIGSALANKRKRKAEEEYQAAINQEIQDIDREIGTSAFDRADAQNAIRKMTDANTEAMRQLNTDAIRGGATDEAKVAMASKLNQGTANLVGDIAAINEQRKDALKEQKRSLKRSLAQHKYSQDADTSGVQTLLSSVGSAANSISNAWGNRPTLTEQVQDFAANMTPTPSSAAPAASQPMSSEDLIDVVNGQYDYGNGRKVSFKRV